MIRMVTAFLALASTVVVGCGNSDAVEPGEPAPIAAASAVPSSLVAPTQVNRTGKPDVAFDPCLEISDTVVSSAGLDPSTRERDDFISDDYAFIGCEFNSDTIMLSITSANLTLSDVVTRFPEREQRRTQVDGRGTLVIPDPEVDNLCEAYVETNTGFLNLSLGFYDPARRQGRQQCDGIVELAELLVTQLPDSE